MPRKPFMPAMLPVLTMWPGAPCAFMCGTNSVRPWTTPMRFTPISHSHAGGGTVSIRPPVPTPALLHSRWMGPKAAIVVSRAEATLARLATSQGTSSSWPVWPERMSAARVRAEASMSARATFMPRARQASTRARPMPLAPPVTKAVRPWSSFMARGWKGRRRGAGAGRARGGSPRGTVCPNRVRPWCPPGSCWGDGGPGGGRGQAKAWRGRRGRSMLWRCRADGAGGKRPCADALARAWTLPG